jgi:hypothetical protein
MLNEWLSTTTLQNTESTLILQPIQNQCRCILVRTVVVGANGDFQASPPTPGLFRVGNIIRANISHAMELAIAMVLPLPTRAIISLTILRITSPPTLAVCIEHVPVLDLVYNCVVKKKSVLVRVCKVSLRKLTPMVSRRVGEMHRQVISLTGILINNASVYDHVSSGRITHDS